MKLQLWMATFALLCAFIAALGFVVNEPLTMAVLVAGPLALASVIVCRKLDADRDLRLAELFLIALCVRWITAVVIEYLVYSSRPLLFALDEGGYAATGAELSRYLSSPNPDPTYDLRRAGIIWMVGVCYYLIGPVILLPKLITGILGAWVAVFTARLGGHLSSDPVGRRAGLMAALFPSLVLWGSILLKDMHTLLGTLMCLFGVMMLVARGHARYLLLIAAGLGLVVANRPYQALFVAAGMVGTYLAGRSGSASKLRSWVMAAVLLLFVVAALSGILSEWIAPGPDQEALAERVNSMRRGYTDADSALDVTGYDTSTPIGFLAWLPIGVGALYLAPIPFTGGSTIAYGTTPEMLLWYALLPSVFRGFKRAYASGSLRRMAGPLTYVVAASVGWATIVTNVGSLYRYRAQTLFLFLFMLAIDQLKQGSAKKQSKESEEPSPVAPGRLAAPVSEIH